MKFAAYLRKRRKRFGDLLVVAVMLAVCAFDLFSYLEFKLEDALYQHPTSADPDIVVIGIDDAAIAEFGPYGQWSRQVMADAINILNSDEEFKPAVIAVDVLYDSLSPNAEADENLARAAENGGNVVMASLAVFGDDYEHDSLADVVRQHITPYESLRNAVTYGFANNITESDGVIRYAPLRFDFFGETLYSFDLEVYRMYTGETESEFLRNNVEMFIPYSGLPGEYMQLSFADIFAEDFEPDFFADCVVYIGAYAVGLMDSYYTPVSSNEQMYGVEIHANILQAMLEENFKTREPSRLPLVLTLCFMIVFFAVAGYIDIRILLAVVAVISSGYVYLAYRMYESGWLMTIIYPVLSLILAYVYQVVYGYILEAIEKRKVKNAFKKYVDPNLVEKLMESGEADSNEVGVRKNIAVLFVDVRGFTPMTEALRDEPDMVVKILNEYLELTASTIFNNGGSVDKFIGDATMALFNGFFPLDDYVFKAVKTAWDMVQGAAAVNASIKEKYGVDVGFGVGVNCGDAIVGNLGPAFRKDYTAIGDTVNTAARLESNAKRSQILISKDVYDATRDRVDAESVGELQLKGKNIKIEIFSVTNVVEAS